MRDSRNSLDLIGVDRNHFHRCPLFKIGKESWCYTCDSLEGGNKELRCKIQDYGTRHVGSVFLKGITYVTHRTQAAKYS